MSQEAFKLIGIVEARTRDAENNLRRVDRVAQTTARSMNSSLGSTEKGFLGAGKAANSFLERFSHISQIIQGIPQIGQLAGALTRPLFQAAEEGIRLNMTLEQASIGYEQVAGSAQKAQRFLNNLQTFGQKSPFRFEGLLQASRLMTAMGFTLDEQIPKLKIWGNAIASSGELSADKIHDVVNAFGQMRMAGRVNAQDMMQLTNANIPGWELLAKAIGKTVAETRKLSEAGRLNGAAAVEAITGTMAQDPRYRGMMDRLQGTTAGRLSAAEDILQFAQAKATKGLTTNISETVGAALNKEDLVNGLASKIDSMLTPISGALKTSITGMLEGNADGLKTAAKDLLGSALSAGLTDGITAGVTSVTSSVTSLISDAVIGPAKNLLGIRSPSKVFEGFGQLCAEGFTIGFADGLNNGTFDGIVEQFLGRIEGKLTNAKQRSATNLAKLMQREPGFKDKLIRGSQQRGINPDDLLNVMAVETAGSFNPAAKNPNSSASGLIQFMAATAQALGTTTEALRKMSATQQLDYVFKYFDKFFKDRDLSTQGALYAAVGAGRVGSNDSSVVMTSRSRGYAGNAATWDPNGDGIVRQGEMAAAAQNKLGAGVNFTVNGSPVNGSNPVPVTATAPIPVTVVNAINALMGQVTHDIQGTKKTRALGGQTIGGEVSASLGSTSININLADAQLKKVDSIVAKMRAGNAELSTSTATLATSIVPKATQAFEQMADSTEQAFKAAGQYAKDVITESEEAVRRMKFDWNAVGAGFESAFQNSFRELFTEGGKRAGLDFLRSFVGSIGDEATRQLSSIISKQLFNFDGGASQSDGGLLGNLTRKLAAKLGIKSKTASSSTVPVTVSSNAAGNATGVAVQQTIKDQTEKIASGQQQQTAAINTQISASADRIVDGLTPRKEGFWKGLLRTTLSAAAGGAAGAATDGLLGGGGGGNTETGSTERPKTAPVLKPYDPTTRTRPRTVGGRAFGGPVGANSSYMIGERGQPEILTMGNTPGWVTPLGSQRSGAGVTHNHYHMPVHIHAADAKGIEKSRRQIERQMASSMQNATRAAA
jgi:tape measure domain-containing protein